MRAASAACCSTARTRSAGTSAATSTATLPLPAPTSHTTPRSGSASLPSATARTSALVTRPSRAAKRLSGRPHSSAGAAATPSPPRRTTTDRGSKAPAASSSRVRTSTRSSGSPRRAHTTARRCDAPSAISSRPSASGRASGAVRTATLAWRVARSAASPSGRPWAEITAASSHGMPSRANASDTEDGAGWTSRRPGPTRSASTRTMPKNPGSPEARMHTASRSRSTRSSTSASGPSIGSVRAPSGARVRRWRGAPATTAAASIAARASLPTGSPPLMPTTAMRSGTGDHLDAVEVDHHDLDFERAVDVRAARGRSLLAQQPQRLDRVVHHANLEEVARRLRLGRGVDDRGRRTALARGSGEDFAVDLRPVEVRHHHAGGELGDLARHADEDDALDAGRRGSSQRDAGEVADLDAAHVVQRRVQPGRGALGPAPSGEQDGALALGGGDVDLLHDRGAICGGREGTHDSGGPEDRDAADDPEAGVRRLRRHRLAARHRDRHDHRLVGDLVERGPDHALGHRIDRGCADGQAETRLRDRADARPGAQLGDARAGLGPLHLGRDAGAVGAVGIVAGVLHDDAPVRRLGLDGKVHPTPGGQADLHVGRRGAGEQPHRGGLRGRARARTGRPPGAQPRRARRDLGREIRLSGGGARGHAGRPTVDPAGDRRRNLCAYSGAYRCDRDAAAPRSAGPTSTSTVRVAPSASSSAARPPSVVATTRSSGHDARTTMAAGVAAVYPLPAVRSSRCSSTGRAADRNTAIVVPWAANAATVSRAGIDAAVRPPRRVRTTLWARVGIVSSRPIAAADAPSELTPGTISNARSLATHQSTCSWIAP